MYKSLGVIGLAGLVLVVGGLGVVALESPIVAGGLLLVLAGLGMVAYGMISKFMQAMGLAGV